MDQKMFIKVATTIFAIVALFHLVRFMLGWGVAIYTFEVPLWWSIVGLIVAGFLAWTGNKLMR